MIVRKLNNNDLNYIEEIANIYSTWWSNNKTTDEIKKELVSSNNIITTKILLDDSYLVGVVQLLVDDNMNLEYTPYLANLYIKENKRGNNLSKILIMDIINTCKNLNYNKLYLHSKHINFYEKYGFKLIKEVNNKRLFSLDI